MEEDLDKFIQTEKLEDMTPRFSGEIKEVTSKFDNVSSIRIIKFDKSSGVSSESKEFFNEFLFAGRHVFYLADLSNTKFCVVMVSPLGIDKVLGNKHVLFHEYTHHFQVAHANFPYIVPKSWSIPPFVEPCIIGPEKGDIRIDGFHLDSDTETITADLCERISDIICDGILIDRNLTAGILERCLEAARPQDPTSFIPPHHPKAMVFKKYVKRLVLWDNAEMNARIRKAYPQKDLSKFLNLIKKYAARLNKGIRNAENTFDKIYELSMSTDYNSFKNSQEIISYLEKVLDLLNIEVSPPLEVI